MLVMIYAFCVIYSQKAIPMAKVIPIVSDNADFLMQPRNQSPLLRVNYRMLHMCGHMYD